MESIQNLTTLSLGLYEAQLTRLPETGKVIQAQYSDTEVVVYQAYKDSIAEYAVEHQGFGGSEFSFQRVSWIKPNFTWMMYRCGWASKDNRQMRVLAIRLKRSFWDKILEEAEAASYNVDSRRRYLTKDAWQKAMRGASVVLQWDPDHEPFTNAKYTRRAIQLGIRPVLLRRFAHDAEDCGIVSIEDITDFVKATEANAMAHEDPLSELWAPIETIYPMPKHLA